MQHDSVAWAPVLLACLTVTACGGGSNTSTTPTPNAPESASAILARCPTAEEVARGDRDLLLSFEHDATAGKVVCTAAQSSRDLTLLQAQTYRVLEIMRRLTFDAPLPWTPGSVYDWLIASIRGIRFRGEDVANSFCCSPANTINVRAVLGPNNSGLASIIFPTDVRAAVGLGVLFAHEARHNNGFPHTCPPFNDRTLSELGAWGVQYHLETYLSTRSDPAFISAAGRTGFMQAAQQTCGRFCDEGCP